MQGEPDFWTNQEKAQKTIQAQKTLNALLKPYEEVTASLNDVTALAELSEEDPTLEPELTGEVDRASGLFEKFELMAMMSGKQDGANALVSIKPGAGGTDACDFAETMYRMYIRWAQRHGFTVEEQDLEPNQEAGIQSVTFKVKGEYAYGYLQSEIGVHRLVRISPFGSGDTRQTSFAAVDVVPELDDDIVIEVNESELEMQTFCSGGPGGRHRTRRSRGQQSTSPASGREPDRERKPVQELRQRPEAAEVPAVRDRGAEADGRPGSGDAKGEIAFGSQIRICDAAVHLVRDSVGDLMKTPNVMGVWTAT